MMFYLSCFLMVSNNPALGGENVTTIIETNKIKKNDDKLEHQNFSECLCAIFRVSITPLSASDWLKCLAYEVGT